jgi:hypothetical protein
MAQNANAKFGLNIRPTQVAQDAEIKALDARVIPQHLHDEQVIKFNEELSKQVGMAGKDLTHPEVQSQMRKVGNDLTNIAANTSMATNKNLYQDLGAIRQDVYATTLDGSPLRAKVDGIISRIFNEIQPTKSGSKWQFELPGTKFRALTKYQGLIDKELGSSTDPAMRTVGHDLKTALFDMFEVADPAKAGLYNKARADYRKLTAIAPLAEKSTSGILDPTKILSQVNRKGLTGDIRELAEAGQHLPKATSTGTAKPAVRENHRNDGLDVDSSFASHMLRSYTMISSGPTHSDTASTCNMSRPTLSATGFVATGCPANESVSVTPTSEAHVPIFHHHVPRN